MARVIATAEDAGRSCPYCRFPLKEGAPAERCDSCGSLHHEDCWVDGGGCAVFGCPQAGTAVRAAAAPTGATLQQYPGQPYPGQPVYTPPPTTVNEPQYGAPPGYSAPPAPPPTGSRSVGPAAVVVAALIALAGIAVGAAAAGGVFSSGKSTATTVPTQPATVSEKSSAPSGPTAAEEESDQQAIVGVLGEYQSAYTGHSVHGLEHIFSPAVKRHGLAAGGCSVTEGMGNVIRDYESQFEEGTGTYELVGLTPSQVQIENATGARVNTHYQITPGGTGYVNFRFVDISGNWKISEIYATCA